MIYRGCKAELAGCWILRFNSVRIDFQQLSMILNFSL